MCFPAYMDEPWGLCSHLCPGGGRVRGKPDLDHFGKGEKGGRGWLFKSAFNSLAANYSQYVKVNATIKTRDALKFLPDASWRSPVKLSQARRGPGAGRLPGTRRGRAGRGPGRTGEVPRGAPRPPARGRAGPSRPSARWGRGRSRGLLWAGPGARAAVPGIAAGPGGTGTGHGSGTASPAELRALPHGASSDGGLGPLPPGQDGASRARCASRGGQPRPSSPLFHSCCGFSRTASASCCQPGALELQSPAATEVASELHAKPFPHYLFISFPPARAVPPSWPEWKSTFKSRTRLSHVVSRQAAVTVTPRSHRAPELPLCPARKAQGDEHF